METTLCGKSRAFQYISFRTLDNCDSYIELWTRAMATLGFDSYIEPLRVYLGKYRDTVKGDRPERVERKPHERIKKEKKPDT